MLGGAAANLSTPVYFSFPQVATFSWRALSKQLQVWFQKPASAEIIPLKVFAARALGPVTGEPHVPHCVCWQCCNTNERHAATQGKRRRSYRLFIGQQLFADPEEVLAKLSQALDEAFLGEGEREEKKTSHYLFSQLQCAHAHTTRQNILFSLYKRAVAEV